MSANPDYRPGPKAKGVPLLDLDNNKVSQDMGHNETTRSADARTLLHAVSRPGVIFALGIDEIEELRSSREWVILGYLAQGYEPKEIAQILFIPRSTLSKLLKNIRQRFDAGSNREAVRKAKDRGYIT